MVYWLFIGLVVRQTGCKDQLLPRCPEASTTSTCPLWGLRCLGTKSHWVFVPPKVAPLEGWSVSLLTSLHLELPSLIRSFVESVFFASVWSTQQNQTPKLGGVGKSIVLVGLGWQSAFHTVDSEKPWRTCPKEKKGRSSKKPTKNKLLLAETRETNQVYQTLFACFFVSWIHFPQIPVDSRRCVPIALPGWSKC